MTYRSAYAEHYQRLETSGGGYDRSLSNRFELAIYELERRVLRDLFQRYCGANPGTRYLDFACGTGRILSVFQGAIRSMVGVDTSPGQLDAARRKVPEAELVEGNLVTDPGLLGGRQFDLITSFRLLLNLEPGNRVPILRALHRSLAPDGYLIVDNHMNRWSALGLTALFAHKVLGMPKKPLVPPGRRGIISTMTESEVRQAMRSAGFEVVEVVRLFVLPGAGRVTLLPTSVLVPLESMLSRIPGLNALTKNQIYVCRPLRQSAA